MLIARALVHDPDVLVFDEPCTGLDPEGMYYVRSSMRTLAKAGKGIVLVTHYPEDIIPEIKRVVLLKNGTVFADGSKGRLLTDGVMSELFDVPLHVQLRRHLLYPARRVRNPPRPVCKQTKISMMLVKRNISRL